MAQDYFELAYDLQMRGDIERALYYYRRSLACMPSPEAYTFMAWTESMRGNYAKAIELCQQAIKLDSDFGNPWNDIGAYLLAMGRHQDAIPFLEQALRSPRYLTYHYAHYNLGRAYERLTRFDRARQKYLDALAADPNYQLARQALARLDAGLEESPAASRNRDTAAPPDRP